MKRTAPLLLGLAGAGLALAAGCTSKKASLAPVVEADRERYADTRVTSTIACGERPVVLAGDRNVLRLTGECRDVTVAGRRNDVHVEVAPGGTIEITGSRNDVTWRQTGPGPAPTLKATGPNNDFHRDRAG